MAEVKMVVVPGHKPIRILKWLVKKGEWIKHGTPLALYRVVEEPSKQAKMKEMHLRSKHVGTLKIFLLQEGQVAVPGGILLEIDGCSHPVVMKDLCAECGEDLRALNIANSKKEQGKKQLASVSMIPSIPELRISTEQAEELGEQDKNRLLRMRKLVLLVDLDQTLIHTTHDPGLAALCQSDEDFYSFQLSKNDPILYTKLRPHCRKFLDEVSKCYELQIVTFGSRLYAHRIADFIDKEKKHFAHRILSRDECMHPFKKSGNLKHLFPCGDSMVCIIDDRDDVWNAVPNLIVVKKYSYFQGTDDINNPFKKKSGRESAKIVKKDEVALPENLQVSRKRELGEVQDDEEVNTKRCRTDQPDEKECEDAERNIGILESPMDETKNLLDSNRNNIVTEKQDDVENGLQKRGSVDEDLNLSSDSDSDSSSSNSSNSTGSSKSSNSSSNSESQNKNKGEVERSEELEREEEVSVNGIHEKQCKISSSADVDKDAKIEDSVIKSNSECDDQPEMMAVCENIPDVEAAANEQVKDPGIETTNNPLENCDKSGKLTKEEESSSGETIPISSQSSQSEGSHSQDPLAREETGFSVGSQGFIAYSDLSSQDSLNDDSKQKFKDTDDYLPYLQDILLQIHSTYYEAYDKYLKKEFKDLPDVRGVVPFLRSKVLYGCCIVLTGVVPHNFRLPPHLHKAYTAARQLGAEVHDQISDRTTHLIANKKGTAKYQQAKKREKQKIKLVSSDWLWCCSERWERVAEELFPVPDKVSSESSSREGTPPPFCQKPAEVTEEIASTYDPVTGKLIRKVRDARLNFMVAEANKRRARQQKILYSSLSVPDTVVPVLSSDEGKPKVLFARPPLDAPQGRHTALAKRNTAPPTSTLAAGRRSRKRSMVEMVGIGYSLSTDDIADMDKEVNDLLESSEDEDDEDNDELGTLIEEAPSSSSQRDSQDVLKEDDLFSVQQTVADDDKDNDDDDDEKDDSSADEFDEMAALLNAEMHYTDEDEDEDDNSDSIH